MNYYEILEVSPAASPEVIRAAYKSLMQRYHPDRNPDDASAAVRATRVVQAYEVLSDAERRAAYDRELQAGRVALEVALLRPAAGGMGRGVARAPEAGAGRGGRTLGYLLLFMLLGAAVWGMFSLRKPAAPAAEPRVAAPERKSAGLEIRALFSDVSIRLKSAGEPAVVLLIPAVGVRVGAKDPDGAVRHLINTREPLAVKLAEQLAEASPEELLKSDGEAYLARIVLAALQDHPARDEDKEGKGGAAPPDVTGYGAVGVFFPEGYRVK